MNGCVEAVFSLAAFDLHCDRLTSISIYRVTDHINSSTNEMKCSPQMFFEVPNRFTFGPIALEPSHTANISAFQFPIKLDIW